MEHIVFHVLITIIALDVIQVINVLLVLITMPFYQVIHKDAAHQIKLGVRLIMLVVLHAKIP